MITVFYSVVAPRWRAWYRPRPGLGSRRPFRWQVVRETRNPATVLRPIGTWGYEHVSLHWTWRGARKAAERAQDGES